MKKIQLNKNILYTIVFFTFVSFLYTFEVTSSRYLASVDVEQDVLAIPIISLNNNTLTYTIKDKIPGFSEDYEFTVTNKKDDRINEILLSYNFEINISGDLPLKVKIFNENDEEINLTNNITTEEQMEYGKEITKNYKLRIYWDENDNSYNYAGKNGIVKLNLKAIQVL